MKVYDLTLHYMRFKFGPHTYAVLITSVMLYECSSEHSLI